MSWNLVALGLLLNKALKSSKSTALFPNDSKKSVKILLAKIISSENTLPAALSEFSEARSKS